MPRIVMRPPGGIGRRAGFRFQWLRLWGFKSPGGHRTATADLAAEGMLAAEQELTAVLAVALKNVGNGLIPRRFAYE